MMDINEVSVKVLKLGDFQSLVGEVCRQLDFQGFKDIRLTYIENKTLEITGVFKGIKLCFEVGSENIYLKDTPFYSKNTEKFIGATKQLIEVD